MAKRKARAGELRRLGAGLTLAELREVLRGWAGAHLGPVRYWCLNAVSDEPGVPDTQVAFSPSPGAEPPSRPDASAGK